MSLPPQMVDIGLLMQRSTLSEYFKYGVPNRRLRHFTARDRKIERSQVATIEMPYEVRSREMNQALLNTHDSEVNATLACTATEKLNRKGRLGESRIG